MALYNLVRVHCTTRGTGTLTLGEAVTGWLDFTNVASGQVTYTVRNGDQTEIGHGTYDSTAGTLARTTVLSSTNNNAAIDIDDDCEVALTISAEDFTAAFLPDGDYGDITVSNSGATWALQSLANLDLNSGAAIRFDTSDVVLTHSLNTLTLTGGSLVLPTAGLTIGNSVPFSDGPPGNLTLQNVDALDATTEATIEAAIDTLANLTSIQGVAFTFGSYAATLLNTTSEATFKAAVNLEIGVDVQAYDADLTSWAGVTRAAGFDTFAATPSSANLASLVTDETGSGALVFATSPTLVTPVIGAATGTSLALSSSTGLSLNSIVPFSGGTPGNLVLQNISSIDAGTEAAIEAAIDTLANLTSIQGRTVTLADAGANAIFGWDDTAGAYENLTAAEATAILNAFTGDSGLGGVKGLVPAPAAGDAAATKFLKADGTWAAPAGAGDVVGPASSTDNALARFDLATGKLIQNSGAILDDSNNLTGLLSIAATATVAATHAATLKNTNDAASVAALRIEGDRATMAANDEVYASFYLSDSGGTQTEYARVTAVATTVTNLSEAGRIDWSVMTAGTLAKEMQLTGTALSPSTSDGLALGTTALMWSDVFIASGGVVNFNNGDVTITHAANFLTFTGGTFAFSDGPVRIGTSSNYAVANQCTILYAGGATEYGMEFKPEADTTVSLYFLNASSGAIGSIGHTNVATSYNTSSDYRLKTDITPLKDGIARLKKLKPSRFRFKADEERKLIDGFIAHEAAEVVPEAVTGTKDEVDEKGKPRIQGMDAAKLIPVLTAALQEAVARIETLEAVVVKLATR